MEISRPVVVKRMPERMNQREARNFLKDVQPFLKADRPQLVFDLSQVKQLDAAGVEMLLHCVSEVMKRDGDLKLASLSPQAAMILELTRTGRMFEIYETSTDAARSFSGFLPNAMRQVPAYQQPASIGERLAA
ncbi:MAG: STAS domain-containing protein [Acidobacteria bacterium]|nr:STAS domain-containing protein [Acidobacteriota bacterium]MBV9145088.1 STAS domain-containing protein [Acidobacteriota bacterium]MBV9436019.1 STAS domain-containing protein [Acidobacteriota bacterium]